MNKTDARMAAIKGDADKLVEAFRASFKQLEGEKDFSFRVTACRSSTEATNSLNETVLSNIAAGKHL